VWSSLARDEHEPERVQLVSISFRRRTTCPRGFPVTSDHRVAGSGHAGCNINTVRDLHVILTAKTAEFLGLCCLNFALIQKLHLAGQRL